jgi:PAS domain S-box-containing protein
MTTEPQLPQPLWKSQSAIAEEWYRAIAGASCVTPGVERVREQLSELTGTAIEVMLDNSFDAGKARGIGAALAELCDLRLEALGQTVGVLERQLAAAASAGESAALQPRLDELLGELSAGFVQKACGTEVGEGEVRWRALIHHLREGDQTLRRAHDELEQRVERRTADLERANEELRLEIIERRRAEEALREGEQKYRELVEDINDVIYALDADGILTYASPATEPFLGYRPDEVVGRHYSKFINPEDLPKLIQIFENLLTGQRQVAEYRVLTKSGEIRWVRASSRAVLDGSQMTAIHGVLIDITNQQAVEEALRESEERWRSLVENAPDFVLTVDRNGRLRFVNRPLWTKDRPKDVVMGMHVCQLAVPEHQPVVRDAVQQVFRTGNSTYFEAAALSADGTRTWYAAHLGPVWRNGTVSLAMLIVRDITERKRLDEIKDNLIRDVSHELRTPLAKVQMSLELLSEILERETLDREKASRISSLSVLNVQRLLQTVEGILDLSRLEAGAWVYQKEAVRLDLLLEEVLQVMQPLAKVKGLRLLVELPEDLPPVEGDWEMLFRVLINLVDNAVKFSEQGQIRISAERKGKDVELTISDEGQGVLAENLDRVFDRFFQEKARYQGVGVGLTISRAIVQGHSGRIWVESEGRGLGATFRCTLPVMPERRAVE